MINFFHKKHWLWAAPVMVGVLLGGSVIHTASAFDPAAAYRNKPGFQCFSQNARGECFDFIYGGNGSTSNNSNSNSNSNNSGNGDVSIEIGAPNSKNLVRRGSVTEFRIVLSNESNGRLTTDVRASLDSGMTFDSASNSGRRLSSTREVEWRNLRIEDNDQKTLYLRVRISSNAKVGDELTLSVEADDGTTQEITVEVTNSSVTNVTCDNTYYYVDGRRVVGRRLSSRRTCEDSFSSSSNNEGDYTIRISDRPDPFEPGQLVTYTMTIENDDSTSRRIDVHAFLDDNADYVSASETPDTIRSDEIIWKDVSIGRDGTKSLTLSVRTRRGLNDGDVIHLRVEAGQGSEEEDTEAFFP